MIASPAAYDLDDDTYRVSQRTLPAPTRRAVVLADRLAPTSRQRLHAAARHARAAGSTYRRRQASFVRTALP